MKVEKEAEKKTIFCSWIIQPSLISSETLNSSKICQVMKKLSLCFDLFLLILVAKYQMQLKERLRVLFCSDEM